MKTLFLLSLTLPGLAGSALGAAEPEDARRALVAYMTVKPGAEARFLELADGVIRESRKEPGNLIYRLHQSTTQPQQFVFYELFETADDLRYHRYAPHTREFLRKTEAITVPGSFRLEEYAHYEGR